VKYFLLYLLFLSVILPVTSQAQSWSFSSAITVSEGSDKTFHHLESAGRKNIAIASQTIAIVWEDNRNGVASIYLALKNKKQAGFSTELKLSTETDAYEPSIVALSHNRFAISWEEDNQVLVRVVDVQQLQSPKLGTIIKLPVNLAMQSSITASDELIFVALAERFGRHSRIRLIQLKLEKQQNRVHNLSLVKNCPVDPDPVTFEQLYPSAVVYDNAEGKNENKTVVIAWEDRRKGHTIIMGTQNKPGKYCQFFSAQRISKLDGKRNLPYGKGHGVSRVALGIFGKADILAAWADKRNFREGYDIYASEFNKVDHWKPNKLVQDDFGGVARQWHATIAGHASGLRLVAWSDERENTADIFYSWFEDGQWSEDLAIPEASGDGEQNHPAVIFDKEGNLHVAWIFRHQVGAPTQLKYVMGHLIDSQE
jgi:hypothetical protein